MCLQFVFLLVTRLAVWSRSGWQKVTLRLDHTSLHVFHDGELIKTHPVTLADTGLARLRAVGGKPARPSPAGVGGKQISAGIHLAGQRVTLRIDAKLIQVITADGGAGPHPARCHRLPAAACTQPASPDPLPHRSPRPCT
jgi:hypothetical protein